MGFDVENLEERCIRSLNRQKGNWRDDALHGHSLFKYGHIPFQHDDLVAVNDMDAKKHCDRIVASDDVTAHVFLKI